MKCFTHEERDAVGTCKSCGKGLCRDCAVDMSKGLACRNKCENEVAALIELIDQNIRLSPVGKNVMGNLRKNSYMGASFFLAAGGIFFLTGLVTGGITGLPGLLGIVFLIYGGYCFWRAVCLPKQ